MCIEKHAGRFAALARIALGWIFLWAFVDKVFGLGFATQAGKAWLDGVSPTAGFLGYATKGPLVGVFHALAGSAVVDWLFMLGLLGIGIALILGIGMRIACWSGTALTFLMWLAVLPPEHNPIIDEHIIYLLVFLWLSAADAGSVWGFGKKWGKTKLVKQYKWLR